MRQLIAVLALLGLSAHAQQPPDGFRPFARDYDAAKPVAISGVVEGLEREGPRLFLLVREEAAARQWRADAGVEGQATVAALRTEVEALQPGARVEVRGFAARTACASACGMALRGVELR